MELQRNEIWGHATRSHCSLTRLSICCMNKKASAIYSQCLYIDLNTSISSISIFMCKYNQIHIHKHRHIHKRKSTHVRINTQVCIYILYMHVLTISNIAMCVYTVDVQYLYTTLGRSYTHIKTPRVTLLDIALSLAAFVFQRCSPENSPLSP